MQKTDISRNVVTHTQMAISNGKPTMPVAGRQPFERRTADPSSCCRKEERYPIPGFYEFRVRNREGVRW